MLVSHCTPVGRQYLPPQGILVLNDTDQDKPKKAAS